MQCYLFSSAPEPSPAALVELVRALVGDRVDPLVAYLPAGNIQRHFVREVKAFLRGVAEVSAVKPEVHSIKRIHSILERADLLLIPGGNTYLMGHRLHQIGIVAELRRRILDGLPVVTFSAGTVFCGQDILTTNDINCCGCTQFDGLKLVPYNFNVHYPVLPGEEQQGRDERLGEYQSFHDLPVLALEDGAYIQITENGMQVHSEVWEFNRGSKVKRKQANGEVMQLA
jgi:peptidase E